MGLKIIDSMNNTGKGLTSIKNLNQGDFVVNYIGELYHSKDPEWKRKQKEYSSSEGRYYTMKIRGGFRVDAYRVGNYASFINHSCDPNCDARQWDH